MRCRTLAAFLALAALTLPSVVAEDPKVTIPKPDPSGAVLDAQAVPGAAAAYAAAASGFASAAPDVAFADCPVPPDPATCHALAIPADEQAALDAQTSDAFDAFLAGAAAVLANSGDGVAIAEAKSDEAGDVFEAVVGVTAPSASDMIRAIGGSTQRHVCPVGGVTLNEPPKAPSVSCGGDSAVTGAQSSGSVLYAAGARLLVRIDVGPTCAAAQRLVASLSPDAGALVDCGALPTGGALVALLPAE